MGPVTPGSRMRGGMAGVVAWTPSTSIETESVQVRPSSSRTGSTAGCQLVEEYIMVPSPAVVGTPSMVQVTDSIFLVPGARQATKSTLARPPEAAVASPSVGSTVATHSGGTRSSLATAI